MLPMNSIPLLLIPFLSILLLSPTTSTPIPTLLSLPHSIHAGFTYDRCTPNDPSICRPGRTCGNSFAAPCTPSSGSCFCFPTSPRTCTLSTDCQSSETCAQNDDNFQLFCASKPAVRDLAILAPAPLPLDTPSPGLTLDDCTAQNPTVCLDARFCQPPTAFGTPCTADQACVCSRSEVDLCFTSADCPDGEICADAPFLELPFCVSPLAAQRRLAVKPIDIPQSNGFTFERCTVDEDCASDRACFFFIAADLEPCDGRTNCACSPPSPQSCDSTADCRSSSEVCADSAFFDTPVCVSIAARDAYDHVRQIGIGDTCPILIPRDLPSTSLAAPREDDDPSFQASSADLSLSSASVRQMLTTAPANQGYDRLSGSIVGGLFASDALRPYMAGFFTLDDSFCSAVLISKKWILAAAHCMAEPGARVVFGGTVASAENAATTIQAVYRNPNFDESKRGDLFDLVAAELRDEAPPSAKFMTVNSKVVIPEENSAVRILGYGRTSQADSSPLTLRQVDVTVVSPERCEEFFKDVLQPVRVRRKLQICIRSEREGCGTCDGDSGGPLIQYQGGEPLLVGIASTLVECATNRFPQIFTRVAGFIEFLRSTPANFTESEAPSINDEAPCQAGEFITTREECSPCPPNQVSRGGRARRCQICSRGFRRDSSDGSLCSCRGEFAAGRGMANGRCQRCPAGTFSGVEDEVCIECAAGTSSDIGATMCEICNHGTHDGCASRTTDFNGI